MRKFDRSKVKELCKERGILQKELADKAGITEEHMSRIMNNKVEPRLNTIRLIAEVLEVDTKTLYIENNLDLEENIGKNVKRLCKEKGLTQKELADKAGIDRNTVSNIINSKHKATISVLGCIARALEVQIEDLYAESDPEVETLGKRIKRLCKENMMTEVELAEKAEIALSTLSGTINGYTNPKRSTLCRIANALGVDVETLYPEEASTLQL